MDTKSNMYCFSKRYLFLGFFILISILFVGSSVLLLKNKEKLQSKASAPAIIGGVDVEEGEYPSVALLSNGCTGVLIDSLWVLTAGHCLDPGLKSVSIGITKKAEYSSKEVKVAEMFRSPQYNRANNYYNDLGLIKLARRVNGIKLPVLPSINDEELMYAQNNMTTLVGWGCVGVNVDPTTYNSDDPTSSYQYIYGGTLQKIDLPIVSPANGDRINEFTAGYSNDYFYSLGTCYGDSGAPLLYKWGDTDFLIGIHSKGAPNGTHQYPSVVTKVMNFVPWINSVIYPGNMLKLLPSPTDIPSPNQTTSEWGQ